MKLNYRKLGNGPEGMPGRKPLFILHGLFGLSDNWASVGKILSETGSTSLTTGFEVYLIDLRNHGSSPHSDEWTYSAMANDIYELINDQLPNSKITLLGHSLGGKVAMQFAAMYPEKLEKLIVIDMAPKNYPEDQFAFIEKLLTINLAELKSRKEVEQQLVKIIKDWATVQLLLKNISPSPSLPSREGGNKLFPEGGVRGGYEWKFNLKVIAENQNVIGKTFTLGEHPINTPALFIRGEKSNYILDSDISEIKKHFHNSEFKTLAGAGHWVHADKPKEFAEAVISFVK